MEPTKSLMPCTMRPFQSRSRSIPAGAERRGKAFWQANEEFIWDVSWCWENLCTLQKATGKASEGTGIGGLRRSCGTVLMLYQQVLDRRWPVGIQGRFSRQVCRFDLPIQFDSRSSQQTAPLSRRLAVRSGLYRNAHPRGRSRTRGSIRELISVDNRVRSLIFTVTGCDSVQVANNNPGLFLTTFTCHQTLLVNIGWVHVFVRNVCSLRRHRRSPRNHR